MSEITGDMTSAVESAFAAASTPDASSTTTVETTAPSASETATTDVTQAAPLETTAKTEPGPIPYPRFKEINDKWTSASKELESLGWAKGVDPKLAQGALQLLTRAQQNPLAFAEELEALRDHPVHGPQLRSWAARTLGTRIASRQSEPADETMPEADLVFEDGRKSYSEGQMQKAIQFALKQFESKVDEKIAPIAKKGEQVDSIVADREWARIRSQADSAAKTEIESLRQQYPQFDEHKQDVAAVMEAHPSYTLAQAWAQVFVEKVGPKLAGQQAATAARKVQAGSANPARPSGAAAPSVPSSIREHLEQLLGS